jgi:hypothetical protein
MSAEEIHCELCAVYGQNVMSDGSVRQWCRILKDGRTNVHNEVRSGRKTITSDETWVSFVNGETKKKSKQWTYTHSPQKPKKV